MKELKKCLKCNGRGAVWVQSFIFKRLVECPECEGEGILLITNKQTKKTLL
jgi:DnaJ-class molecular chaperone